MLVGTLIRRVNAAKKPPADKVIDNIIRARPFTLYPRIFKGAGVKRASQSLFAFHFNTDL